jgi:hypothetical protein
MTMANLAAKLGLNPEDRAGVKMPEAPRPDDPSKKFKTLGPHS